MTLVVHTVTLYNTCELAYTTRDDIMADKLAKETFCIDSTVIGFNIHKELRDCLVSHSKANIHPCCKLVM